MLFLCDALAGTLRTQELGPQQKGVHIISSPSTRKHAQRLAAAAGVLTLVGVVVAPLAFAKIILNTIDPVAVVTDHGRHLMVTLVRNSPLDCTPTERAKVRVTVTQRTTGAVAQGRTTIACTDAHQWLVQITPVADDPPAKPY